MIKSTSGVKKYLNKIRNGNVENPFFSRECTDALKILAENKDEEGFRTVVDFVRSQAVKEKKNKVVKAYNGEPLALIESFCIVIDNPVMINYYLLQTYRGIKMKRLKMGKTQRFFQKLYGSHFFVKR